MTEYQIRQYFQEEGVHPYPAFKKERENKNVQDRGGETSLNIFLRLLWIVSFCLSVHVFHFRNRIPFSAY
jgi:hypothetical protein